MQLDCEITLQYIEHLVARSGGSFEMNPKLSTRQFLASIVFAIGIGYQPHPLFAEQSYVTLPKIENNTVAPRLI